MVSLLSSCRLLGVIILLNVAIRAIKQDNVDNIEFPEDSYVQDVKIKKRQADATTTTGQCSSSQANRQYLNKKLIGHEIFNGSADDVTRCVELCVYFSACQSVGFYNKKKQCIMYDVDSTSAAAEDFEDLTGFIFSDINVFPMAMASGCKSRPCRVDQICLPTIENYLCKNIDCGRPPTVPHSSNNASSTHFPSVVEFTCNKGYVLHGAATTMCMANSKWTNFPDCLKGYLGTTNCMDTTNLVNGDKRTCEQVFGTGSTCVQGLCICSAAGYIPNFTYTACEQGYVGTTNCITSNNLITGDSRTCQQVFGTDVVCLGDRCECSVGIASGCNTTLKGPAGEITSPNYPGSYGSNATCVNAITVAPGKSVQIQILEFDVEKNHDFLMVYSACNSTIEAAKLSGQAMPVPAVYTSTSNVMMIKFVTDSSVENRGFKLKYSEGLFLGTTHCLDTNNLVNGDKRTCEQVFGTGSTCVQGLCMCTAAGYVPNMTSTACEQGYVGTTNCITSNNLITGDSRTCQQVFGTDVVCLGDKCECSVGITSGCSTKLKGPTGEVTSPNYPNIYGSSAECVHAITVAPGKRVQIEILDFDVEKYDFLMVYSACNSTIEAAKLTGQAMPVPTVYTSSSNVMMLKFVTDSSVEYRGFKLQYSEV